MRVGPLLLAVLLLPLLARPLAAQSSAAFAEVRPGARVRVEAPGIVAGRYVGTVLARAGDTLTLGNPSGAPVALSFGTIRSLEISRGKSRSAGAMRGIVWGAPIGLAAGALASGFSDRCTSCTDEPSTAEGIALFTVSGVLWGAGIGAIVGRERWERFVLPARTSLRVERRSVALAVVLPR